MLSMRMYFLRIKKYSFLLMNCREPTTPLSSSMKKRRLNMHNPIFDYDDGDFIYQTSGNMGIDSDGNLHMRMGDNMSMDMETGELHFNSGWETGVDDDDF